MRITINDVNEPPDATGTIVPVSVLVGGSPVTRDVTDFFDDPDDGDTISYTAASDDMAVATVTVSGSTVSITPVAAGAATVTVTATDAAGLTGTTQAIDVVVIEPDADATLSALTISAGTLTPAFAPAITSYTAAVRNTVTSLTVTPTANNAAATIAVDGNAVASGAASSAIALTVGSNTIDIVVTASDGTTMDTYTVEVDRLVTPIIDVPGVYMVLENRADRFVGAPLAARGFTGSGGAWSITAGNTDNAFAINAMDGQIRVVTALDFETAQSHTLTVQFTQDGQTAMAQVTITVRNEVEPPTAVGAIDPVSAPLAGGPVDVDVAANFAEGDGGALTYTAASDDTAVATVSVVGSVVAITPVAVGSATVTVTATDTDNQTTTQDIAVTVSDSDATLSALAISAGTLTPAFASDITSYTASVLNSVGSLTVTPTANSDAATIAVDGNAVTSGAASNAIDLIGGPNTINIVVTAQDGSTETYVVEVERLLVPPTVTVIGTHSIVENVADRNIGAPLVARGFTGSGGAWSITAGNTGDVFSITAAGQIRLIAALDYETIPSYTLTVQFTQDGQTAMAQVTVTVVNQVEPPTAVRDIDPVSAPLAGGPVDVDVAANFAEGDGGALTYTAVSDDTAVATVRVVGSVVTITPVAAGSATVTVTAMDTDNQGTTQDIAVTVPSAGPVPSADATLSALAISAGTLTPAFAPGAISYTASVGHSVASLTVTPTANDATGASITVDGATVSSGAASGAIALAVGSNTITIVVTAEDGATIETYTVMVTRAAPSTDATLSALAISAGTLTPAFASGATSYTASVGHRVTSLTVTPTANDATGASIMVNDNMVSSGAASGAIALTVGSNTITIMVTAEDGAATQTYTVTITRATLMADATLSGLTVSAGTLTPAFAFGITSYTASVGHGVASLTVTPTANNATGASIMVNDNMVSSGAASGAIALVVGENTIDIEVTSEDGMAMQTYRVTVTRGTAETSSRVTESVLPHVAQAVVASTLSAITGRLDAALDGPPALAGQSNLFQALKASERALEDGTADLAQVLDDASFLMSLNADQDEGDARTGDVAVWGSGDYRNLSGPDDGSGDWDGEMSVFHLGADMRVRPGLLAGATVSHSSGSFDYADRSGPDPATGTYDSRMTAVHPYLSLSTGDGPRLWAAVGYGQGEIKISESGRAGQSSDTEMWTAAMGASHVLASDDGLIEGRAVTLRLKGEGAAANIKIDGGGSIRPARFGVRHVRAALEGGYECLPGSSGGQCLTPSLEAGLRHDGGDARTGLGIEVGGALRYTDQALGLTLEGRGRALVLDGDDRDDWSVGGLIRINPSGDRLGFSFSLEPGFGDAASRPERLYDQDPSLRELRDVREPAGRLEIGVGYGFAGLGGSGVVTPYAGASLAGEEANDYRVGGRLEFGSGFSVWLEGQRRERESSEPDDRIVFRGRVRW